jgi:hypothetical protein
MYFKLFPKIYYSFNYKNDSFVASTNLFSRFKIKDSVIENALVFYKYQVTDGETAETISFKLYEDPRYHWVICMCNNIVDPLFDLPLPVQSLEKKIITEYGYSTIEESMSAVHHYELVVDSVYTGADGFTTESSETREVSTGQYDFSTNTVSNIVLNNPVTEEIVLRANNADLSSEILYTISKTSTYREVSVFDYETAQNEKNRWIKILKRQYIPMLISELELMHNG